MSIYNVLKNATTTITAPQNNAVCQPIAQGAGLGQPAQTVAITANVTGTGAVTATVQPVVSNDGLTWSNFGTAISLSGTTSANGNFTAQAPFTYWSTIVTAISGTSATVNALLSA